MNGLLRLFIIMLGLGLFLAAGDGFAGEAQAGKAISAKRLALGERMYRDGLLPSGAPLEAYIRDDIPVDSTAFSCSSCHLRAGLGSVEGGVVTPPTSGQKLYRPYRRPPSLDEIAGRDGRSIYAKTIAERPAYDRKSLARALRDGVDPAGEVFNDVMPRYLLEDADMEILIDYLESLSARPSPGVEGNTLRFATVITDDVTPEERQSLLKTLQRFVDERNQQEELYRAFLDFGYVPTLEMKNAFRRATLTVWDLKGQAKTWPEQLAAYSRKEPVFAVLGGMSHQSWAPIHEFCEEERLPCLFPLTDLPAVDRPGWYTYYFNRGFYQEGEAAARFLGPDSATGLLQLVQPGAAGAALAAGFDAGRREIGAPPAERIAADAERLKPENLKRLLTEMNAEVLLLWGDATLLTALRQAGMPEKSRLFFSSQALGADTLAIPDELRSRSYLTYPYRLTPYAGSGEGGFYARYPVKPDAASLGSSRIASRTASMLQLAALQGLKLLYDDLYRDYLLDIMSMQMDQVVADYERLSFGPGQRFASKGCYVIQLGPGEKPELLPRSDWVIH